MKAYSNWQAPLWRDESRMIKYFDIPINGRFEVISPMAVNSLWQVEYTLNGKVLVGYIEDRFMEWYLQVLPSNLVDIEGLQTPDLNDAQQYIIWDGVKKVNMCGELCAALVMDKPLIEILQKWQSVDVPFFKRIVSAGKGTGTNTDDLIRLFGIFGYIARTIKLVKYTPRIFMELVENSKGVIVSTHLNTVTGALNGGGTLHWCTVLEVIPERMDMGWVRLYNPYNNVEEWYSWREFLATTRAPYGVVV